jgi:hypothetical protein
MAKYEDIYRGIGRKIGEVHHDIGRDNYYSPTGDYLGRTDKNGTRDKIDRIVADKPLGGLLIPKKK